MDRTPPRPPRVIVGDRTPWRLLILLMAMTAIGPIALNIIVPALPHLGAAFTAGADTVQLSVSLFLVGLAVAQLLIGPLSDRFGRRPVALGGLALAAVASLASVAASDVLTFVATRVLQAFGAATGLVIGRAVIRDLFERDRAAAMIGLVTTVMMVAPMASPLVGGLLDTAFGWRAIFVFLAAVAAIVFLYALAALPETHERHPANAGEGFFVDLRRLAASVPFNAYVACATFGSATFFAFLGGGAHVVVTMMGRSSAEYGVWFALFSIGYTSGNFATSRLSTRFGIDRLILWGLVLETIGALASMAGSAAHQFGPGVLFLPQIVVSFGNGLMLPGAIAGAVSVRPQAAGTASGVLGFVQMAVGALFAQLGGLVVAGASTQLSLAMLVMASVALYGLAFWVLARHRSRADQGP